MENKARSRILNKTDLSQIFPSFYQIKKAIAGARIPTSIKPCAGGLGEAPRPPVGVWGATPQDRVFHRNNYFLLKSVPFELTRRKLLFHGVYVNPKLLRNLFNHLRFLWCRYPIPLSNTFTLSQQRHRKITVELLKKLI